MIAMNRISATAIIFLSLGLLATSFVQVGPASGDDQQDRPWRVLRLVERAQDFAFQDVDPPGPSLGDRVIFTSNLFDEDGRAVERDGADCVTVRLDPTAPPAEQQIVQCTVTVELSDRQITSQGLARGLQSRFAVTGGTGVYRTARGEAHVRDTAPLVEAEITITLFR